MHDSVPSHRSVGVIAGALGSALAVLLIGTAVEAWGPRGGGAAAAPVPQTGAADGGDFVSDGECASCHAGQFRAWQESHHFHAMEAPDAASVRGDFDDTTFTDANARYRFFRRDGRYLVEITDDAGANEHEVRYTFGWDPLQQYLVDGERGRLQALTVAWDTDQGRWFDLSQDNPAPAGDPLHWTGRDYNWNFRCADCHSTDLKRNYDLETDSFATAYAAVNVGCQACHGPGREHIAWARDGDDARAAPSGNGLIVALSDPAGQIETCARCHARRRPITAAAVPGEPFLDHYIPELIEADLYHADGQILDEVFEYGSFLQSRMHQAGVACSDCHEPHSGALHADGNAVCTACHNKTPPERFSSITPLDYDSPAHHFHAQGRTGSFCVDCHMPARTYMMVDPRRDHSLRVPRPDLAEVTGAPDACTGCHADRDPAWAAGHIAAWYGPGRRAEPHFGEALALARLGGPGAGASLAALARDAAAPALVRASAVQMLRDYLDQRTGPAILAALGDPDPLVRIAALRSLEAVEPTARLDLAAPLLEDPLRAVRITAARVLAPVPDIAFLGERRTTYDRAAGEFVASELAAAERPESHLNLGLYWAERGNVEKSEAAYRTALRLAPDFVPALINLADLERARGQTGEEANLIEQAHAIAPQEASVLHALGLLRVRQARHDEALPLLARAAATAPESARYAYVHAVALDSLGRRQEAHTAAAAALERHPYDVDLLAWFLQHQLRAGDRAAARSTLDRLIMLRPDDANLARLRTEIGGP